jgi:hypothetical protein
LALKFGSQTEKIVRKEMTLFEAIKKRRENLEKLYKALKTIPPTSIEAENRYFIYWNIWAKKFG